MTNLLTSASCEFPATIAGTLYFFVASDWGDVVDLAHASRQTSSEVLLAPRRRTPCSIHGSLDVARGVSQLLAHRAAAYRVELLEIIVIVLIFIEIMLAFYGHY